MAGKMVEMRSETQIIRNCEGLWLLSNTDNVASLTDSITYTESLMEAKSPVQYTKELSQSNKQKNAGLNMEIQNKWLVVAVVLNGKLLPSGCLLAVSHYGMLTPHWSKRVWIMAKGFKKVCGFLPKDSLKSMLRTLKKIMK